jgi:tRNA(Leu) C34 or U34 (ribose-2'-O)-methylase TrmL
VKATIQDFTFGDLIKVKKEGELFEEDIAPSIILYNPKYIHNLGNVVRACSCFGAKAVIFTGNRLTLGTSWENEKYRLPREERMKDYKKIQIIRDEYPFNRFPKGIVPVAVEKRENSENLVNFEHPKNAVYVFGPEDGGISQTFLRHCHRFVIIPSIHCTNLSAAVYIVLYDRMAKEIMRG